MVETRPERAFEKVLVANRGEIARRVLRTLRELGLASVAVYSDADEGAPHVTEADEAVRLGPGPSGESYLNIDRILEAAKATGADAVHPGYGFLSENAAFAQRCVDAGLVFIGPSPSAIARMGSKIESKRIALAAGVPVIEGFATAGLSPAEIGKETKALGYPVLVKASAGGGGRGMRVVQSPGELGDALASAEREAQAAFGDGSLLIERYLEAPRHVEVQVFGDAHGNLIHCFERECSIQRRHQKVIEEAPCPALDPALRARMGAAAVALGRAIEYTGAGTVELMLAAGEFYFLEMNTRLQVEHPVTEAVTGLDLVRMQLEVAQGLPLALRQEDLELRGHAIEARLYAEDATRDFVPGTGRVTLFARPTLPGLRIDSGVEAGSEVSVHYDALLCKVIAHGDSREQARRRLARGLSELAVGGLTTNRDFLRQVLEHPCFAAGETDTQFIARHLPEARRAQPPSAELHAIAATLFLHEQRRAATKPLPPSLPSGWRNLHAEPQRQRFTCDGRTLEVRYIARAEGHFDVGTSVLEGTEGDMSVPTRARLVTLEGDLLALELDRVRRRFRLAQQGEQLTVHGAGHSAELQCVPRFPPRGSALLAGGCVAPMTGVVRKLCVAVGDRVAQGDLLLLLEAMKMEHRLICHAPGVVTEVRVREGQMVDPDDVLVVVEPATGD